MPHPDDPGVLLGAVGALTPGVAGAVVSLCRLGAGQVPLAGVAPQDHVEVWLVDDEDAKALNAIRQLIDEVDSGRYPGLFLVITGTPAFYDGPSGVPRLPPLAQRIATDFATDARFDNPRAVQLRLPGFDEATLVSLGTRVRDLYAGGASEPDRLRGVVDDGYVAVLAAAVTGSLGGKVGIAPRVFLKKLVGEVLDRVDQFADFDPHRHYALTLNASELSVVERNAAALAPRSTASPDDVHLDL